MQYIVFEGIEGSGKSTAMSNVHQSLTDLNIDHIITRHPGSTPLGKHLRLLTKYPEEIDKNIILDELSTQLFMVIDAINFNRTILKPSLDAGVVVLADRCNPISMLAYGIAEGLSYLQIDKLLNIIEPMKPDKLYIMDCSPEVSYDRMLKQNGGDKTGLDRFERKGLPYVKKLYELYHSLMTGDPAFVTLARQCVNFQSIIYIDSTQDPVVISQQISADIVKGLREIGRDI